jgi:hypothetical protein
MIIIDLPVWFPPMGLWFLLAGCAGMFANFLSKRGKGEIKAVSIWRYLFIDRPGRTAASLISMTAATFGAIAIGGLEEMKITTAVAAGFTSGWALDAGINKGQATHPIPECKEERGA